MQMSCRPPPTDGRPRAALQTVVTGLADQRVVVVVAEQSVLALSAQQRVVTVAAAQPGRPRRRPT